MNIQIPKFWQDQPSMKWPTDAGPRTRGFMNINALNTENISKK